MKSYAGIQNQKKQTKFEVLEQKGKIINRQIIDITLENDEELDSAVNDIAGQIERLESTLASMQEMLESLRQQKEALLRYKGEL